MPQHAQSTRWQQRSANSNTTLHNSRTPDDLFDPHESDSLISASASSTNAQDDRLVHSVKSQGQFDTLRYRALRRKDTIRLLQLHPSDGHQDNDDTLRCSLRHYELHSDDRPSYRALSYTWGVDDAQHPLHTGGGTVLMIRDNLRSALLALRGRNSCWLWVDAVCIDQESADERSHQVKLMAEIYSSANIVVIWLHSAGEQDDLQKAFGFIESSVVYSLALEDGGRPQDQGTPELWKLVQKFIGYRYWTRKWIIQETVFARTVMLRAGKSACPMGAFERFCQGLEQEKIAAPDTFIEAFKTSPARALALERVQAPEQQGRLLCHMIQRYANSECGQACDHVYALYNLVGKHRIHLDVNYGATSLERLESVLRFIGKYELPKSDMLPYVELLMKLFDIEYPAIIQRNDPFDPTLVTVAIMRSDPIMPQEESEESMILRSHVDPLRSTTGIALTWVRANTGRITMDQWSDLGNPSISGEDMAYFTATAGHYTVQGLASCRIMPGDTLLYVPGTKLVLVSREPRIVGRAYLFTSSAEWYQKNPPNIQHLTLADQYRRAANLVGDEIHRKKSDGPILRNYPLWLASKPTYEDVSVRDAVVTLTLNALARLVKLTVPRSATLLSLPSENITIQERNIANEIARKREQEAQLTAQKVYERKSFDFQQHSRDLAKEYEISTLQQQFMVLRNLADHHSA